MKSVLKNRYNIILMIVLFVIVVIGILTFCIGYSDDTETNNIKMLASAFNGGYATGSTGSYEDMTTQPSVPTTQPSTFLPTGSTGDYEDPTEDPATDVEGPTEPVTEPTEPSTTLPPISYPTTSPTLPVTPTLPATQAPTISATVPPPYGVYPETGVAGTCGENTSYVLDENTGTLTIYGTGATYNFATTGSQTNLAGTPWRSYTSSIKTVVVENGVTTIGDYIFYNCNNLTSVVLPNSVTKIGKSSFSTCTRLLSVTIPDGVTSIGSVAFSGCTSLTSVTIPKNITSIESAVFASCSRLESVIIDKQVTNIGSGAFNDCVSLKTVYYAGTQAEWNSISIMPNNSSLILANIVYNSTGPTTDVPTTSTQPVTPPTTSGNTSNATTTLQTNAPAVNNVTTTSTTTEAKPAGAKKVDGVWVNSKYKKTSIKKLKKAKKSFKVTFKKVSGVKGYQIQYSTSKKFTKKTTKSTTISKNSAKNPSKTIKKLKSKKTYYVRVRTYKTVKVNGKNVKVYSKWSKVKSVKTK